MEVCQNSDGSISSKFETVDLPEISIQQLFFDEISKHNPDSDALVNVETDEKYTYGELISGIKRVSSGLTKLGVKKNDVILFFMPNCLEIPIMLIASVTCGIKISPANFTYTSFELKHQLTNSMASYIFTDSSLLPKVLEAKSNNIKKIIVFGDTNIKSKECISFYDLLNDNGSHFQVDKHDVNPKNDVFLIPYSSGTTGLPKGVEITHYNVASMIKLFLTAGTITEANDNYLLAYLPMYHAFGLQTTISSLISGKTCIVFPRFIPDLFFKCIEKYKPYSLAVVPPIVNFLINSPMTRKVDFSSLKKIASGAAPLSKSAEKKLKELLKIDYVFQGYGMTETTLATVVSSIEFNRSGSCGRLLPNTSLKVVDPETLKVLGINQKGELWFKGPQIMKGYYNNTEATKNTLTNDKWLKTGDIGYFDADGYIFVVDRIKELIKYKGFQVAPAELEGVIANHPSVNDVGVIGIPDERAGEIPMAFIVKKPNVSLTKKDINDYLQKLLTDYKQLRGGIAFVDSIPKTASGKILRRKLKEMRKSYLKSNL